MKVFTVFVVLACAFCALATDVEMTPEELKMLDDCFLPLNVEGEATDFCQECMFIVETKDDLYYVECTKMVWCLGITTEMVKGDGSLDINIITEKAQEGLSRLNIKKSLDEIMEVSEPCIKAYETDLPNKSTQEEKEELLFELTKCNIEAIMKIL